MKILKFGMAGCQPCKQLSKVVEGMGDVGVPIVDVDVDEAQEVAIRYAIRGVPTCVLVDADGNELRRKVGSMTEADFRQFVTG